MAFTLHIHFHLQHQEGLWKVCSVKDRNIRFAGIHFRFLSQGDVITSVKRLKTDQPSANVMSKVSPNMPTSDIRSFHNIFPKSSHVPNCFQNQVVYRAPFKRFDLFLHMFSQFLCVSCSSPRDKHATKAACQDRGSLGSFVFPRGSPTLAAHLRCGQEWIQSI